MVITRDDLLKTAADGSLDIMTIARSVIRSVLEELGWTNFTQPSTPDRRRMTLELTLTLTDDDGIRALNSRFRGLDTSTDVLSFPLLEPAELEGLAQGDELPGHPPELPLLLGDIVINLPEACRAAQRYGHSLRREVGFLIAHGFLHLLGFDHDTPATESEMNATTEAALRRLGLTRADS